MCGVQCGQNSPDLALQKVALDCSVSVCVCAATVVQHTFNCKVSTFGGEIPVSEIYWSIISKQKKRTSPQALQMCNVPYSANQMNRC